MIRAFKHQRAIYIYIYIYIYTHTHTHTHTHICTRVIQKLLSQPDRSAQTKFFFYSYTLSLLIKLIQIF